MRGARSGWFALRVGRSVRSSTSEARALGEARKVAASPCCLEDFDRRFEWSASREAPQIALQEALCGLWPREPLRHAGLCMVALRVAASGSGFV